MSFRVRFEWLLAFGLLAGGQAWAQQYQSGPPGPPYGGAPIQCPPPEGYYANSAVGGGWAPSPDVYAELLPNDRGGRFDTDSRRDLNFRQMLRGSYLRMEYLHGFIQKYDERTLGTPIDVTNPAPIPGPAQDVVDVANQFLLVFTDLTSTATNATGLAHRYGQVATTSGVDWHDAQGIRAGFGIPVLDVMSVEAAFTGYMNQSAQLQVPTIPAVNPSAPGLQPLLDDNGNTIIEGPHGTNVTTFLATTLTTDGVPGSRVILYDAGFTSYYEARYLAGNVDAVFNWKTPAEGFRAQPILGYRHEQYGEVMGFSGTFDNRSAYYNTAGIYATPQRNALESSILNQRDQFEIGMRNELALRFVTLGLQEKFGLGGNVVRSTVSTNNFREPGTVSGTLDDPAVTTSRQRDVVFAPTFDLDVYAKVRVTEWLNFRVGYNLVWLGNVGVADQSIRFNEVSDGAGGTTVDVGSRLGYRDRVISALTLGGEIILP